jgi:diguanylate cyclase (GGDEF) domain
MSSSRPLSFVQIAVAILALGLVAYEVTNVPADSIRLLLFFSLLVFISALLRIETKLGAVGFEAVVAFAVIMIFRSTALAVLPVFIGTLLCEAWEAISRMKFGIARLSRVGAMTLAIGFVSVMHTSTVPPVAGTAAQVSGYLLLFAGYLFAMIAWDWVVCSLEGDVHSARLWETFIAQGKVLLLISPIVAVEVLIYPDYRMLGFAVAYLPVLFVAFFMKNEAEAEKQNVVLVRRNRELSLLTESASQLLAAEGDDQTIIRLSKLLGNLFKMKACGIVTWETALDKPMHVYRFGDCAPPDQAISKWVESAGFSEAAPKSATAIASSQRSFRLTEEYANQVIVGIQTIEVIYGVLIFETDEPTVLEPETLSLFTLLASQTAVSLQDQLLKQLMREKTAQLDKQYETTKAILDVSNQLIGEYDIEHALTLIAHAIRQSLGFGIVLFALRTGKREEFVGVAQVGHSDDVKKKRVRAKDLTEDLTDDFRMSNSYFIPTLREEYDLGTKQEDWHPLDKLIVPLRSGNELLGFVQVKMPDNGKIPTLEKIRSLEVFANQAVRTLESARQYAEIKRLTTIDALTPAYNHRHFQDALVREVRRHERSKRSFAVAMIDIDNFKSINDTYGHPVGDEILKGLVDILMGNVREIDIVARYGGEEFVLILPETSITRAFEVSNRLRQLVAARDFEFSHLERDLRITISIGVAAFPDDGMTNTDLISRADAALYRAKKTGKNRVVLASALETPAKAQIPDRI